MPTARETILAALHARLTTLPATALRGDVLPERVPADGLLILRDGEPGEPEVTLSPLAYHTSTGPRSRRSYKAQIVTPPLTRSAPASARRSRRTARWAGSATGSRRRRRGRSICRSRVRRA
jgi:hypothetical protein